jgi:hypothetical protein
MILWAKFQIIKKYSFLCIWITEHSYRRMIKKILSISTIVLTLAAILNISVATHYCGGMIASSKVSLSGELSSCGMENDDIVQPAISGLIFSSHCCENIVKRYNVTGTYFPSFSSFPESFQQHIQTFEVPELSFRYAFAPLKNLTSESPPVILYNSHVDLSDICIFRI